MKQVKHLDAHNEALHYTYADRHMDETVSKYAIPESGMDARVAYQVVRDELNLDGNPALNLASFVTTWMEPEADQLLRDSANKNLVDQDEYPQTEEIHQRVVSMMGRMLNAPKDCDPVGTCTVGSSEAIMLGLLAHKWSWKSVASRPGCPSKSPTSSSPPMCIPVGRSSRCILTLKCAWCRSSPTSST